MRKNLVVRVLAGVALVGAVILMVVALINARFGTGSYDVVTTNFIGYDLARAVLGDSASVRMLVPPGAEVHDYEPKPQDIVDMKNAKLLIYNGGESESWVKELLEKNEVSKSNTLRLMDLVDAQDEDEHIWTSLKNTMSLAAGVQAKLSSIFPAEAGKFAENTKQYIAKLDSLDQSIRKVVQDSPKKTLFFGDRFPFLYFVNEYGLDYRAAYAGCAEQTEVNAKTMTELIEAAKEAKAKIILKTELSSNKIAQLIATEVGAEVREFSAAHNISKEDFENGVTYLDILKRNIEVLEEALR